MAQGDVVTTVVGNLTGPPELRFTPAGAAVINFTVASTTRVFDKQTNEYRDGDTLFLRCNLWRQPAENLAETDLKAGSRVIATGRLKQRSFEVEGQKRTVVELEVDEVGPSLKFATAVVNKTSRNGGGSPAFGSSGTGRGAPVEDTADPWGSAPAPSGGPQDSDMAPF